MPLPSQQPRSTGVSPPRFGRGGGRGGRRRAQRRRFGALAVIVLAVLIVWFFWPGGERKTPLEAKADSSAEQPAAARTEPKPSEATRSANSQTSTSLAERAREQQQQRDANDAQERASALAARNEQRLAEQAAAAKEKAPEPVAKPTTTPNNATPAHTPEPEPTTLAESAPAQTPREVIEEPQPVRETPPVVTSASAGEAIQQAESAIARNDPVEARDILNRTLNNPRLGEADKAALRARLAEVAETLTFSPRVFPGDVTADTYTIQSGDVLGAIPRREGFRIDHRLIQRVNRIENPRRIQVGQRMKVLYGPFHLFIDKSEFRMDVFADQTDTAGNRLYIRSFTVGLGEFDSTPVGKWRVPARSNGEKLINPGWTNPRTNETFKPEDPNNPIGEYWIPLEGIDQRTQGVNGYGIHGTIDPDSIGKQMSMGCVRLGPEDIAMVYELVVPELSTIEITN